MSLPPFSQNGVSSLVCLTSWSTLFSLWGRLRSTNSGGRNWKSVSPAIVTRNLTCSSLFSRTLRDMERRQSETS